MTHRRWWSGQSGHQSTNDTPRVVGVEPGPSRGAQNKDPGRTERESRAPDATHRQRKRKKEMREEKFSRDDSKKRRNSNFHGRKIKT